VNPIRLCAVVATLGLSCAHAQGAELAGLVVGVSDGDGDGDTITVLGASKVQHKVRLAGMDAPEKRQPFGDAAKRGLSALVFQKSVRVSWNKTDKYHRLVGVVRPEATGADANLEQLRAGLAWHYKAYEAEQAPAERARYAAAEAQARAARLGLWRDPSPLPPWVFSHPERAASKAASAASGPQKKKPPSLAVRGTKFSS
jgi:endonuclease YncB( thermonuclease family)